jgi:hypothetical protein
MGKVMVRPRNIQMKVDTAYFKDVTPLWVGPGRPSVVDRYDDAVDALVKWVGPDWPNNETSNFFPMRECLIRSCKSWAEHDWQSDADWIERRRLNAKHLPELESAFTKFLAVMEKAPFRNEKKMLGVAFSTEFWSEPPSDMTNKQAIDAVERALEWYGQRLKVRDRGYTRYGTITYAGIPRQLPRKEVAIALSLADRITFMRRNGFSEGTLFCPHKPKISNNLPWKAIALFASANCNNAEDELDASNIQTLVTSLAKKVEFVDWTSDAVGNPESKPSETNVV